MAKSEFGLLYDTLGNDPSDALQQAFITWAKANLPNRDAAEPSSADAGNAGFSTAGQKLDYLVKSYIAREDASSSYADAMTHFEQTRKCRPQGCLRQGKRTRQRMSRRSQELAAALTGR